MGRIVQACFVMCIGWLASCSSSEETNGSGSGGSSGAGGATQENCMTSECFAPFKCVHECGGPVTVNGCCACAPPLIDVGSCAMDAASGGGQADSSQD